MNYWMLVNMKKQAKADKKKLLYFLFIKDRSRQNCIEINLPVKASASHNVSIASFLYSKSLNGVIYMEK